MFRFVLSPGTNSNHCHEGVLLRGTLDNFNDEKRADPSIVVNLNPGMA